MLRASNNAYDYSFYEQQELQTAVETNTKPLNKTKKKQKPKTHLISILFVFGLSILIISRYAYMAEINFNITNLEKEYKKVVKENTDLNVQLMKTINLEALESAALQSLNMQYPDVRNQIVYVNVAEEAKTAVTAGSDFYNASDVQENKYIAYTKAAINNILNVLD
jgi:cell division protein FtsB